MPSGTVHAALGVGVGAGVVLKDPALLPPIAHVAAVAGVVGVAGFGALIPDVDLRQSTLGRYVPWFSWIPGIHHRGITHRLRWVPVCWLVGTVAVAHWLPLPLAVTLGASLALGFLSHLVADRPLRFWREV